MPTVEPRLYNHRTVARMIDIDTETLRGWVNEDPSVWPQPVAIINNTWFFDAAVIEHWMRHGAWPEGTHFKHDPRRERTRR